MAETRHELLENLERITSEIANLKKTIILEFKPARDGKNRAIWKDLQEIIKQLAPRWDKVSAVDEIRRQRGK
jgi:hypothetical protein